MVIPPCFDDSWPGFPYLLSPWQASPLSFCQLRCCRYSFQSFPPGRLLDFYGVPKLFVLGLELFRRRLPRAIRIQAQGNLSDGGVVPQVCVQGSFIQAAQGDGVAGNLPVQGEVAH